MLNEIQILKIHLTYTSTSSTAIFEGKLHILGSMSSVVDVLWVSVNMEYYVVMSVPSSDIFTACNIFWR